MQLPMFVLQTDVEFGKRRGHESCKVMHVHSQIGSSQRKHLQTFRQDQGEDAWCGVSPGLADFSTPRSGLVLYDNKSTQRNPALTWLIHWPVLIFGAWKGLSTGVTPVVLKQGLPQNCQRGAGCS